MQAQQAVRLAWQHHTIVPAFNIPYLPMAKPVAQAIIDEKTVAMLQVARLEWEKFESQSLEAVAEEYFKYYDPKYTLLHLDHVPVIDEDQKRVDYMPILERAVKAGYQSVMVDGSRLSLAENIAVTKQVADFAHANDIACEAELGSVMGHEGAGANIRPTNAHWARQTTWKRPAPPSIPARARSSARSASKETRKNCSDK